MSDEGFIWKLFPRNGAGLVEHLCQIRGIDPGQIEPDFAGHLHDPNLLSGMKEARVLVRAAVASKETAVIFGDYDADGTPAAAILSMTFKRLGLAHRVILPTRETGYGLKSDVVEAIKGEAGLLVTVDTGITAVEEIALAKKYGLKVIVIDHHLPKATLPPADAIIDPLIPASTYPFTQLCGCALAFKLISALGEDFPKEISEGYTKWLLDIVAIATVADMMPLIGENRTLVHYGLKVLAKTRWPGLSELIDVAGLNRGELSSYSLGFMLGPRLNASGRLSDNRPALELLLAEDRQTARKIARQIELANSDRKDLVKDTLQQAEAKLWLQNDRADHLLVVSGEDWPSGVLGLVAGKLAGQLNRPVIVLTEAAGELSGSGRSIEDYPLIEGLEQSSSHLTRFGGHRLAAGLALSKGNLPKFVDSIKKHALTNLPKAKLRRSLVIDTVLDSSELTNQTAELISRFAPFGHGNPAPLVLCQSLGINGARRIGSGGEHFKGLVSLGEATVELVGFGLADRYFADPLTAADLVGNLEINNWNGRQSLQLKIKDLRPAGAGADETLLLPA